MANLEKHPKTCMQEIDQADFSEVPTSARSPHLLGQYIKNRQNGYRNHIPQASERTQTILLRFEDLPATPRNLERIRERVRTLNGRLLESGTPFRLRVV